MTDPRSVCATCGHSFEWHDRAMARAKLGSDPPFERACYRDVRGIACPCNGFKDSGEPQFSPRSRTAGQRLIQNSILTLLLVVMGLALLYAYRSQTPAVTQVPITQAVRDVQAGRVRSIVITNTTAVLTLRDGTREQTVVPQPNNVLVDAVTAYNAANTRDQVDLRYEASSEPFSVIGSVLLSLLPVLLIGGFFFYMMAQARRRS